VPRSDPPGRFIPGWGWLVLWGALVALALAQRPLLPVDETRYLSVAWEMWRRGDWVVPHLNGAPYADKPPLLFWGMLLGWRVLGVNEWWPRLLPPILGLTSALLLARLAARLSPDGPRSGDQAMPFLSGFLWVTYTTLVLFDTLLTTCVLVALAGVVDAWRGRPLRGWVTFAAGLGLGALAKGPVVLVHVLPVALLAPWWATDPRPARWGRWYLGLGAGVALGAAIALAWALPAAARGGPAYRAAILWEQTAGRLVHAFAHRRPWWWYLSLLPLVLYPWALWPPLWRSLARLGRGAVDLPARFALAWVVPGLIALSVISGKQVHYLIPLLPGFALLASAACSRAGEPARRRDAAPAAALLALTGALLLAGDGLHARLRFPGWVNQISPAWGGVLLIGALALVMLTGRRRQVIALSFTSPALLIGVHLAGGRLLARSYDLRPLAACLKAAEESRRPVAHVGDYAGQFHFLGRLERPLEVVTEDQLDGWEAANPAGLVVRHVRSEADTAGALLARPYGLGEVGIWAAQRDSAAHCPSA
jgi:4-amino-4-deoxy-L-arabinose transferase-like glycosyltransferase